MSRPEVRTESLGGSPLSVAARAGRLGQWYPPLPSDRSEWSAYARDVAGSVPADWLTALAPAFSTRGAAARRLERSADGKGIVVTTGQQPGLFGGPIMTLAKAISARALADTVAEVTGLPVAPVFWAATDDADFDEASVVSVATDSGCEELRLARRPAAGTPMFRVAVEETIGALADRLCTACGSAPHAHYLETATREYTRPGATIGSAYVGLLRELLEPLEIAVLDASHAAVLSRTQGLLSRALRLADPISSAVRTRSDAIRAAGFEPQVEEVPGLSLVSITEDGVKRRLPIAQARRASDSQAVFSSTVLLRPVMERAILPTAAYVGGPGEVAYFGQVSAVAEAMAAALPRVVPRWSTTIIEPRIQKILDGLGMSVEDFADPHAAESRVARQRMSPTLDAAVRALRADLQRGLDGLKSANRDLLSTRAIEGARRGLEHRIARLERRVLAAVKQHEASAMREIAAVRGSLYPHGIRQERQLSFVPFLVRYGPELLEQMLDAARAHARGIVGVEAATAISSGAATARV